MSKDRYESPLASRYASEFMLHLFSQDARIQTWRRLWVALARAEHNLGLPVTAEQYQALAGMLTGPMIQKEQRRYPLPGGLTLEVNQVDQGESGSFFYAEVEFPTREAALAWEPGKWAGYLSREVTGQPGQSMAAYWLATRGHAGGIDAPAALEK